VGWGHGIGIMAVWSFNYLFRFLAIPLAMTGFLLVASQTGGFVLRRDQPLKLDSHLVSPTNPVKYPRS
jgi:hypothetical protein